MPLEAPASLLFTGTAIRQQGKKTYGVYCMQCQDRDGKTWTCEKRYSEFVSLKKALIKDKCVKVKQFENLAHGQGRFPKKGAKSTDPAAMEERKLALDMWLKNVMKLYSENLNLCAFFKPVAAIQRDTGVGAAFKASTASTVGEEPEPDSDDDFDVSQYEEDPADVSFGVETAEVETAASGADEYIIGKHEIGSVNAVCMAGDVLISVGDDKGIQLWDLGAEKMTCRMNNNRIIKSVIAMSENVIATGNEDGTIKTWDIDPEAVNEDGEKKKWSQRARRLETLEGHAGAVLALARINDTTVVSGSHDNSLIAWESDTGTQITKLEGHEASVNDVIAVDGSTIASCSADRSVKIWHFAPSEPGGSSLKISMDECHKGQNVLVLCKISEAVIVSGGGDMVAKVWDVSDGGCLSSLAGHTSAVQALAVIGDRMLATGSADMTVRLWDIDAHYKLVKTVGAAKGGINFSINGLCAVSDTRFASAADNIKIWSIETADD